MNIHVVYLNHVSVSSLPFYLSYDEFSPGMGHQLHAIVKLRRDPRRDLDSYRVYAKQHPEADWLLFFNSYTVITADHWLTKFWEPVRRGSLLVGATSSLRSFYSNRPTWWRRFFFPPQPNFHIRTNGFLIQRKLMLDIWPKWIWFKKRAYCFESGWRSMTRRAQEYGAAPVALDNLKLIEDNHVCK